MNDFEEELAEGYEVAWMFTLGSENFTATMQPPRFGRVTVLKRTKKKAVLTRRFAVANFVLHVPVSDLFETREAAVVAVRQKALELAQWHRKQAEAFEAAVR